MHEWIHSKKDRQVDEIILFISVQQKGVMKINDSKDSNHDVIPKENWSILFYFYFIPYYVKRIKKQKNFKIQINTFSQNRINHALNIKSIQLYTLTVWIDDKRCFLLYTFESD